MKTILARLSAALALAFCGSAAAQAFPAKPIRLIVTYPPGGGADLMARLVAPKMPEAGVAGYEVYEVYEWNAIFAPAGTPAPVVAKISEAIGKESARFVSEQTELWGKVVRQGNIRVE